VSVSVFAERPSYMSYYDDDDDEDNNVLADDNDASYEPLFRMERFTS